MKNGLFLLILGLSWINFLVAWNYKKPPAVRRLLGRELMMVRGGTGSPDDSSSLSSMHRSVRCGNDTILLKLVFKKVEENTNKKLPIVLFLGGADCPAESYMWLATRLAQEGYCVVLSSCVVSLGESNTMLLSTPYDMSLLSSLEAYKKNPATEGLQSILQDLASMEFLDSKRLVVGGHSTGGRIVLDLVSFDNPFVDIKAAFSYGASLVNSNDSPLGKRGAVQPCDRSKTPPPPLLLLGGSQDGISAVLSESQKDPTETLERTFQEAFSTNYNGDVDWIVFNGINHMAFCSPVDPTCGATQRDWVSSVDTEIAREVMGSAIVDFCNNHVHDNRNSTTPFQPRIPPQMYHTARSIRSKSSLTPKLCLKSGGSDSDEDNQQKEDIIWKKLSAKMDEWIDSVIASSLNLVPTSKPLSPSHSIGIKENLNLTVSLKGWESNQVTWAVRYENCVTNSTTSSSSHSLGFNVWLSEKVNAPHLTIHVGVRNNKVSIMADLIPREDFALTIGDLDQYRQTIEDQWTLLKQRGEMGGGKTFTSSDATVRAIQSPYNIAFVWDVDAPEEAIWYDWLDLYFRSWLEMIQASSRGGSSLSEDVGIRDDALRRILLQHERTAGERILEKSLAKSLAHQMAGYFI